MGDTVTVEPATESGDAIKEIQNDSPPAYTFVDKNGRNVEERASWLNILFFRFAEPLISYGYKNTLTEKDMWQISKQDNCDTSTPKLAALWAEDQAKRGEKASIFAMIFKYFRWQLFVVACQQVISRTGQLLQPIVLEEFLLWYVNPFAEDYEGYLWAATFFAIPFVSAICDAASAHRSTHGMIQIRGALARLTFEKSLRISSTTKIADLEVPNAAAKARVKKKQSMSARKKSQKPADVAKDVAFQKREAIKSEASKSTATTGKIVNLMSVDAEKVAMMFLMLPQAIMVPVQAMVNIALIYKTMKGATFVGLGTIFVFVPFMAMCMKIQVKFSSKQSSLADTRLKITNELLQGFRVVKFYAWEKSFMKRLQDIRCIESVQIFKTVVAFQGIIVIFNVLPVMMPVFTFLTFTELWGNLNAVVIFRTLAYFQGLQMPLVFIPIVLSQVAVGMVSSKRIQTFFETVRNGFGCSQKTY